MPFRVADVHAGQVRGEERGFFAALTGLHFEDDVVAVMRITRRQLIGKRLLELRDLGFEIGDLGGEAGIVGG